LPFFGLPAGSASAALGTGSAALGCSGALAVGITSASLRTLALTLACSKSSSAFFFNSSALFISSCFLSSFLYSISLFVIA